MDLSLRAEDEAFALLFRGWLDEHLEEPPAFSDVADEVAWGRAWQATLAADRWVGVHWPEAYGGRGATPVQVALYQSEYARARAPQPVNRVGINLVGPTLLAHGTDEQRTRWMPKILAAEEIWCQLFSEPDAGSDLASLRTRAVKVEGGYVVSGRKVWTSYAQFARFGLCLARSNPEGKAQESITALVVDMTDPAIAISPLVQMTGDAEFNEVTLDEVFVPDDRRIGEEGHGWTVANSTLAHERGTNFPFKEQLVHEMYLARILGDSPEALDDADLADALAGAWIDLGVLRLHNLRTLTRLGRGEEPGPESSWIKLTWSAMTQHLSEAGLAVALAMGDPEAGLSGPWPRQWLWSFAASIAGGTSEIQRDIIAGRILGLPR